ncbi:uncharacterized protein BcabD6B2_25850 [Babesia caballi]|uniref:Uncharacterized protein n=1 Tax=Babesia caballi TaxID=5871 RepID=A0AAV4LU98_BABCB|nr:hypothetical protein BcabD6B2_25850 [Babesia caballi]
MNGFSNAKKTTSGNDVMGHNNPGKEDVEDLHPSHTVHAPRRDPKAGKRPDNGVRGRNGHSEPRRAHEPDGGAGAGAHHSHRQFSRRIVESIKVEHSGADRVRNRAPECNRAYNFEDEGYGDGAAKFQRPASHRRRESISHVVCSDSHGKEGAHETRGHYHPEQLWMCNRHSRQFGSQRFKREYILIYIFDEKQRRDSTTNYGRPTHF